jgi:hypothetical protein
VPKFLRVAADTEYDGPRTLTVQLAARLPSDPAAVVVQVYHHPDLPEPPDGFADGLADGYPGRVERLIVRPPQLLTNNLSPAAMVADLLGLTGFAGRDRGDVAVELAATPAPADGRGAHLLRDVRWDARSHTWRAPEVRLELVCHFLRADLARLFGSRFVGRMRAGGPHARPVRLADRKVLAYADGGRRTDAILEYLARPGELYALRVAFRDTTLPFGPASLDSLSKTFLGVGKCDLVTDAEKERMAGVFRARPADAYRYAVTDPVHTLLVHEAMEAEDRRVSAALGLPPPPGTTMRPTLGGRVSRLVVAASGRALGDAAGPRSGVAAILRAGGRAINLPPHTSKFGDQVATVHGGLLYTRSPDRFWHDAPGLLRDADLKSCYNTALAGLHAYLGRPVLFEPGAAGWTLEQAVAFARGHADDDAWLVRVTGPIAGYRNTLIPSTRGAVTSRGYRAHARHAVAADDDGPGAGPRPGWSSRLYTGAVEYGVVTAATWRAIRMLPPTARRQYERLSVETLMLYPRVLVAENVDEYRELVRRHAGAAVPWEQVLDLGRLELTERRRLDAEFVSLRLPLGELAGRMAEGRAAARAAHGKGSGPELAWKVTANAVYGVLASPHLPTFNVMAANQVTARARAVVFVIGQCLNAVQTITDGVTYRADQVPGVGYAECLGRHPAYPARRAEAGSGVGFLPPETVPAADDAFNAWLVDHAAGFFSVPRADVEALFGALSAEHKAGPGGAVGFDALGCDGPGNYVKCRLSPEGGWEPFAVAMRGYGREAKDRLVPFLVAAYASDTLSELPPLAEDEDLLSPDRAMAEVRRAVAGGSGPVRFPLGFALRRVKNYKLIKPSAFLFRDPAQESRVLRQVGRFETEWGCGLEVLALRRGYGGRRSGSVAGVAAVVVRVVEAGGHRVLQALNAHKAGAELRALAQSRAEGMEARRRAIAAEFETRIVAREPLAGAAEAPTAVLLTVADTDFLLRRR